VAQPGLTRLVVAQVRGLHGLEGAVRVEVLTDKPEARFATGQVLHAEGDPRPLTISSAQPVEDGPGWRLRFSEVPNRQSSEWLRERYLEVEVDRGADLETGAAYWHELIGSTVRDSHGTELGKVVDIYRAGENEVYVVRGGPVGEFDLPAVKDVITTFAPERREIVVDEVVLDLGGAAVESPGPAAKTTSATRRRPRWSRHGKGAKAPDAASPEDAPPDAAAESPPPSASDVPAT
jgi:16S rRNA processing protein RimM